MSHGTVASDHSLECEEGYFCLFEGPHQTGKVLYAQEVKISEEGLEFHDEGGIEPPIFPRSARNPFSDAWPCFLSLFEQPNRRGGEQDISGFGDHELDGRRVASFIRVAN